MGAILRSSLFMQPVTQIDYKKTIDRLESRMIDWQAINLACSPNFVPVIKDIKKLKQALDPKAYQQLFIYINGEKTLRDLAIASQKDILEIARSFATHLKSKAIMMQQYELCAQIKKMPGFKNIPVVISRQQENTIDLIRGKMPGVSDFINQPLESTELLTLAQKYTQSIADDLVT